MTGAALLFAVMSTMVRLASQGLPTSMVVFARNLVGLVVLLPWLPRLGPRGLRTRSLRNHLVRGLAGVAAMFCFFFAVSRMRLAEAVLLNYSLPLFMPFIERGWLHEPIPRKLWAGLGLGFLGVTLVLKPGTSLFQTAALIGLGAGMLGALAQVAVRRLTRDEPAVRIVFYFALISTLASAVPLAWTWKTPPRELWWVLLAMGTLATLGQLVLTRAYAQAPAAQVGPFVYSAVVFAALLEGWLWSRWPDPASWLGAALVVLAAVWTLRRLEGRRAARPPSGLTA